MKGAETATNPAQRAWFEADRKLREKLTLRDIGIWSHYVGDGSQPLHASVHHNGWGDFPNPDGFSSAKTLYAHFEGAFVRQNLDRAVVAGAVGPYQDCGCPIAVHAKAYILASLAYVIPLYTLEKQGAFKNGNKQGIDFTTARLAAGAQMTRDMIVDAWRASAGTMVGFPMVNVRDIESGKITLTKEMFGAD